MNKVECSEQCFLSGFNCAQAVFSTYSGELGLDPVLALRIAGSFGGGMGLIGETCGAVTGAIMLIGLKYGKVRVDDTAAKEKTYALVQEYKRQFVELNGSVRCKELLGYDISIPEEMSTAGEKNLFKTLCPKLVKDSAEIVEKLLELK
ncbi:C_GCAxxG_C_C family protein [Ruminiclostridium papyrosolvens DSM 2782]|uniref:C_GCAxxG_C_C family protein n=1 Tax=Ruminiclostridium papyrosolvens DSM 2782 TaxID=588581 RepID=F1TD95_9FIRM|nr:C-GCAxxG-C-C family protein [Ruminiclostridium papyrosolvens]EGD47533.1 C_GCAxxG_C_C family protein [Ruminiclostridium papyrosolvens DSM 2782]WES36520.1 C-GCAxxG-C-C family protein [Ruminiclostridium papyrosolvens DSM 2782]